MINNIVNLFHFRQNRNNINFEGKKEAKKKASDSKPYYGQIQYFYSDPDSFLPVRDVCNKQKAGFKTEPHIENGSENFIKPCAQHNIKGAINKGCDYLFLLTKCVNKQLKEFFGNQYIVGYIKIKESLDRTTKDGKPFSCAKGDVRMVSFEDAISVKDEFGFNLSRSGISKYGKLDKETADRFAKHIDSRPDIIGKLIDEIIALDKDNVTCIGKSCASCGQCARYKKMQGSKTFVA